MKKISYDCKNCGADVPSGTEEKSVCLFCGAEYLPDENSETITCSPAQVSEIGKAAGTRQRVWHTILPPAIMLLTIFPLYFFYDEIIGNVFGFLEPRTSETLFWVLSTAWTVFSVYKNIAFFFQLAETIEILRMPKELVIVKPQSITLAKAVKITDEELAEYAKKHDTEIPFVYEQRGNFPRYSAMDS